MSRIDLPNDVCAFDHLDLPEYFFTSVAKIAVVGPVLRYTFALDEGPEISKHRIPIFRAMVPLENVAVNMQSTEAFLAALRRQQMLLAN